MTSAANPQAYGPQAYGPQGADARWGSGPTGGPTWQNNPWHWDSPWALHNLPRPFAILVMVTGFILWWPVGLAILFYMIGSGRMSCRSFRRNGNNPGSPWQRGAPWAGWRNWCGGEQASSTSGNHAFDEYRAETLRRLEQEQKDFAAFLERLRFAKDKAEFDQFMTDRRQPPAQPDPTAQPAG